MNHLDLQWIRQRLADHAARPIEAPKRAAVAIIFNAPPEAECCEILFILRAIQQHDPWSGHMAFPGGRMEPRDEVALDTACRETLEEVRIDLKRDAELLGALDDVQASARGRVVPLSITPFVWWLNNPVTIRPNEEVEEVHWLPVSALLDPGHASTVPYLLGDQHYDLPALRFRDRVIWGLTYQMLMRLFTVLRWRIGR